MEQKAVSEKKFPQKEANRITHILDTALPEYIRFPVDVKMMAKELTPSFNQNPITAVNSGCMGNSVDGMLVKHDTKDEWAIFYNTDAVHPGRYFATKQDCVEVPEFSLAAQEQYSTKARDGVRHGLGIWFLGKEVIEHSIYSKEYEKSLTILVLDDVGGYSDPDDFNEDDELLTDSYTNFINNGQNPY